MMDRPCALRVAPRRSPLLLLLLVTLSAPPLAAEAAEPHIHFDPLYTAACRDVTSEEFRQLNPDEMLVELNLPVSSLIKSGREEDLIEYFYEVQFPERSARVHDYEPKTTMKSDYAGNVGIEKKSEKTRSLGLGVNGSFEHLLHGSLNGSIGDKDSTTVRYELVPEMEAVAASGTVQRGHGVYFKLKPSRDASLEGTKTFTLILRVPASWRNDYLKLSCRAIGRRPSMVPSMSEKGLIGGADFLISLYLAGDERAKQVAEQFSHSESLLRHLARQHHEQIRESAYPSAAHKFGALLAVVEPKISSRWLPELLFAPGAGRSTDVTRYLPEPVRTAAEEFIDAKRQLHLRCR